MKIIDKNTDFYDYLQNVYRDDSLTFDRTDSFILDKDLMRQHLRSDYSRRWSNIFSHKNEEPFDYHFVLLQICNTFWLFLVELFEVDTLDIPKDYKVELLTSWQNFNKPRKLISLEVIKMQWAVDHFTIIKHSKENIIKRLSVIKQLIDTNDYRVKDHINYHVMYRGNDYDHKIEKHIPLLKASGLANCLDPLEVYTAFEQYFSLEKTASERRESIGLTDTEKIENHGFDKKSSFRNIK